jgi:hypothetical protein
VHTQFLMNEAPKRTPGQMGSVHCLRRRSSHPIYAVLSMGDFFRDMFAD